MNFSNPLFYLSLSLALTFIVAGFIQLKFPPKEINHLYGYRTKLSMKSLEHWRFAQKYSAKLMVISSVIFSLLSIVSLFLKEFEELQIILGLGLLLGLTIVGYFLTERKLKEKFGND